MFSKIDMEPTSLVCRASSSAIRMCVPRTEYVLSWAIRQNLRARKISPRIKVNWTLSAFGINSSDLLLDLQWSKKHGFFIIMGGFHLFERGSREASDIKPISHEEDIPLHPLAAIDLYGDNTALDIDFPSFTVPTEAEIKGKGKSDWLTKSLVLLQTSWFCIARAVKHLPITHLEIMTLAYAAMNFVIYIFWWNKPLNVNRPLQVFRKSERSEMQPQPISEARELTWVAVFEVISQEVKICMST